MHLRGRQSPLQRRGSSAEAAITAETARLNTANGVLKHGFLLKKGHLMPTRKERYFVLGENSLSYYKPTKEGDVQFKGVLELKTTDVISPKPHSDVWLRVRQSKGPDGKSYKLDLKASSLKERREWIEALRKACRGEHLARQRPLQSDMRLQRARTSRRDGNAKTMLELLSSPMGSDNVDPGASIHQVDVRASFQIFHETVLLKKLVDTIKSSWGPASEWSMLQYEELVQGINLTQEKSGSADFEPDSILAEAFRLRYQFEEIPENQRKLSRGDDSLNGSSRQLGQSECSPTTTPRMAPRIRCPSFHSYYAPFEELSGRAGQTIKAAATGQGEAEILTPRSATLAKYAHLYLVDDVRAKQPWGLDRADDDDLITEFADANCVSDAEIVEMLSRRFENDQIYTYINHHTMVAMNPYRLLQTARFTSIYDEQVVLTYSDTDSAEAVLAPHPFAIAKQCLVRLFFDRKDASRNTTPISTGVTKRSPTVNIGQSLFICGESGSGKTELAKDILKYLVLVAQPALSRDSLGRDNNNIRHPKVKLFTSSTKSTIQMRTEEARTIALLEAKGVESYEIVLLDLHPERWEEMTAVSHSKRLPQVHVDGLFFGFYDKLERLEDEEQLRMYFKNPHAAKKLSTVLDSNILLEAFGHATTSMNLNSSRFGKITTLQVSFGLHPWEFQIQGCHIAPFLLEKARVTGARSNGVLGEMNFHVLYSMVTGVNACQSMRLLAQELRLNDTECSTFTYLGQCDHKLAEFMSKEDTLKKDVERWQQVVDGMNELNISRDHQNTIFKMLSAVLWLGNIELAYDASSKRLKMSSISASEVPERVVELLGLESVGILERMLMTKSVSLQATGETFELALEKGQVNHVRDSLARLLYQRAFDYMVFMMNEATKMDDTSGDSAGAMHARGMSLLKIVDVFGFEDLTHNSLDQLCINYLSEKLYVREEQIVMAAYSYQAPGSVNSPGETKDVLQIYEHPLGIFASLEEVTFLHQSESETVQQEEKRNGLFVRNVYERNVPRLPDPPRLLTNGKSQSSTKSMLPFVIPHTRGNIVYDASDFVKKNSDFVYANLLAGLETSNNSHFLRILAHSRDVSATFGVNENADNKMSGSKSSVGQFRLQVHALTSGEEMLMPFFFHCIRPNATKQPSSLNKDIVVQQIHSQRLARQVQVCGGALSSYFAMSISKSTVLARYHSLLQPPYTGSVVTGDDQSLVRWLSDILCSNGCQSPQIIVFDSSTVKFKTVSLVEKLELLLKDREAKAAAKIQALFLMIKWRLRYLSAKRERKDLRNELLEWYGPSNQDTVTKLLIKYSGRENDLRVRLTLKKREKFQGEKMEFELARDLKSLCLGQNGGLDAQTVNDILHDDGMRQLLQQNEKIVLALRDMSLNPGVLETQLTDPVLRAFYQKLVAFLQSKREGGDQKNASERISDEGPQCSLEERVVAFASETNRALWMRIAESDEWIAHHDALVEVGEDPEMFLFHSEDDEFVDTLERFLTKLALEKEYEEEQKVLNAIGNLSRSSSVDEEGKSQNSAEACKEDEEMLGLLLSVQFGPFLMAAMNQDSYFVQALQDSTLMNSMHQLMANPTDFARSTALRQPTVREFFLKLIALSLAIQSD